MKYSLHQHCSEHNIMVSCLFGAICRADDHCPTVCDGLLIQYHVTPLMDLFVRKSLN